jgi:hypothetical protein
VEVVGKVRKGVVGIIKGLELGLDLGDGWCSDIAECLRLILR